mgnify:CR=1 FL=1
MRKINEEHLWGILKGAMREGDYGLFITLSDFTSNARKYLDNNPIIKGLR